MSTNILELMVFVLPELEGEVLEKSTHLLLDFAEYLYVFATEY